MKTYKATIGLEPTLHEERKFWIEEGDKPPGVRLGDPVFFPVGYELRMEWDEDDVMRERSVVVLSPPPVLPEWLRGYSVFNLVNVDGKRVTLGSRIDSPS